jgi:hypothetical protein
LSPLTKLFVVLLVVTSMLTTAGFIVFVTKAQLLQPTLDRASANEAAAKAQAASAQEAGQLAQEQYQAEVTVHQKDRAADAALNTSLQSSLNENNVRVAQLEKDKADRDATITTLTNNSTLQTATIGTLQDQNAQLRSDNEKLVKQAEEFNRHNSELTRMNETLTARLNNTSEKLQTSMENNQKLAGYMKDHSLNPDDALKGPGAVGPGAQAITGSVREKSLINGQTYVTIDVGSSDGVIKGMQFYVLDRNSGNFLAQMTVDSVDSHNASGPVAAPNNDQLNQVQVGSDVKTQLRGS